MAEAAVNPEDEKKNEAVNRDEKEKEFFSSHAEIGKLEEKMRTKNKQHPLYDLKSNEQETWCVELAELVLKSKLVDITNEKTLSESLNKLYEFEYHCFNNLKKRDNPSNDYGLLFFLGFNMARSRLNMLLLKTKKVQCQLTVIVPMYGEQNRMQSVDVHKNGEDFIRRKVKQLNWLFMDINTNEMDWNLIFVDDGCPNNSGKLAMELIESDKDIFTDTIKQKISIEFLEKGLETIEKFKNDENLKTTKDSKKGGAVQMGMYIALNQEIKNDKKQFIMYTDSDLSSNISQSGLFLSQITVNNSKNSRVAVVGNRYSKGIFSDGEVYGIFKSQSVAMSLRWLFRGELLPPLKGFYDTQCGYKLFTRECIEKVLPKITDYKGMFDMELLLKTFDEYINYDVDDKKTEKSSVNTEEIIYSEGVVWLNSAEETTFNTAAFTEDFTEEYGKKHYGQLQQIINIHNNNYKENKLCSDEWIQFLTDLKWETYFKLCQVIFAKVMSGKLDVYNWSPSLNDIQSFIQEKI